MKKRGRDLISKKFILQFYLLINIGNNISVYLSSSAMKTMCPGNFYSYFKDCYKLDYKEFIVDNLLSVKYKYKWFVSHKEELLNDSLPCIPYDNPKLQELERDIELYKLEKKLFYACFFILGTSDNPLVKDKRICAPLVLFPATIRTNDDLNFLEIDKQSFIINRSILSKLEVIDSTLTKELFIQEFSETIRNNHGNPLWIKGIIDKYFSNIETEELLFSPTVWSDKKIKSSYSNKKYNSDYYKIVPAAGTVFVDKSYSSLGVLNDLSELSKQEEFNTSLEELFELEPTVKTFESSLFEKCLNPGQSKALINANTYNNSIIIGPPGTGKSYTITSLVADAVVNGKSVLVVSKTKQAVEVIRKMLNENYRLRDYLIHTTGNKFKLSLKSKLQKYLSGITLQDPSHFNKQEVYRLYHSICAKEKEFNELVEKELRWSDIEFNGNTSFLSNIRKTFIQLGMGNGAKLWNLFSEIENLNLKFDREIKYFCKRKIHHSIRKNSNRYRKDISQYYDALDASSFTENKEITSRINHKNILKIFPVWLANMADLNAVLPFEKELFDLVIIDEATQCDIASALPAIYRGKSIVISGDPNQLRHYSFVSHSQQSNLLKKYKLHVDKIFDYRNRSILDFYLMKVQSQDQVSFLREHFRSTPSLIEFSNQHFYEGQLQVLKTTSKHTESSQIELIEVNGERNSSGINEKEANAIIEKLDELISQYIENKIVPSIGIISLFSSQVNYINKLLREKYDLKIIKKFNIVCGTPYNFQGSEREITLLSFVVCDNTHHSAFIHANKPEVLNVAITRAKSFQYLFKSVSDQKINKESLLAQYFSFVKNFTLSKNEESVTDEFQQEVVDALKKKGINNIKCGFPVAGSLLDILIERYGKSYFIDLIGYPGDFKQAFSMERYKTLGRMGIKSFPLHYSYWKKDKIKILTRLVKFLN